MYFDGIVFERPIGDPVASNIYLVSVCGMDFAGRQHDVDDIRKYVTNWYVLSSLSLSLSLFLSLSLSLSLSLWQLQQEESVSFDWWGTQGPFRWTVC